MKLNSLLILTLLGCATYLFVTGGSGSKVTWAESPPSPRPKPAAKSSGARLVSGPSAQINSMIARGATATISLQPVPPKTQPPSNYPPGSVIDGRRLTLGSVPARVWFEVQISGWAPDALRTVQIRISATDPEMDGGGYDGDNAQCGGVPTNGGDLFPATVPCVSNVDCRAAVSGLTGGCQTGEPSRCVARPAYYPPGGNICQPGFLDTCDPEFVSAGLGHVSASDISTLNFRYGSAIDNAFDAMTDFAPSYMGTVVLDVPGDAKGTYTIDFIEGILETFLLDSLNFDIPIGVFSPAEISIPCGSCCFDVGGAAPGCTDGLSAAECAARPQPVNFTADGACLNPPTDDGCCACLTNADCNDGDACTQDLCVNCVCPNPAVASWDQATECCDWVTGVETTLGCADQCELAACSAPGHYGTAQCLPRTAGEACDDGNPCTFSDSCTNGAGSCAGIDANTVSCVNLADCEAVTGIAYPCDAGFCTCTIEFIDCDGDGVLDWEESNPAQRDCDRDGICNGVEIANCPAGDSSCADCNGNSIPDGCETDCNGNQIADSCDIANCVPGDASCADCTDNGIPDGCEPDCNNNQVADGCEIANCQPGDESCADCNSNGIPDGCEEGGCCLDLDQDGVYESCSPGSLQSCAQANGAWRGACQPCPTQNTLIVPEPGGGVFVHVIGPPIESDCRFVAATKVARDGCPPGGPFFDAWKSEADASMCHNFGAPGHSIPADFFDPGSDVFASSLCLQGVPLGTPGFGEADTLIQRSADPFDRCALPSPTPVGVQIDIFALSLTGTQPITVTYNGGQNPEFWNVAVDRSVVIPPSGMLTVTKTHCNGGTYTSVLNVQPRFTFSKVNNPSLIRVLDTGLAGIPYIILDQQIPAPWIQDADPNLGLTGDPCSHFHAGIEDAVQSTACDCNANSARDTCDLGSGLSGDCNRNAIPDECDISGATSFDIDPANGVPDECDAGPAPLVDPTGINKTRFISFSVVGRATAAAAESALRVKLVSLHHVNPPYTGGPSEPFTALEGQVRWVGPPSLQAESTSTLTPFTASQLQCMPHYRDWSTVGLLHVFGSAIVPSSIYEVENVAASCAGIEATCTAVSAPLSIRTTRWGDVEQPYNPPSTTTQPDVGDISAMVNKFKSAPSAPIKARAMLMGSDAFGTINIGPDLSFTHIAGCVDAFKGQAYPFAIATCP